MPSQWELYVYYPAAMPSTHPRLGSLTDGPPLPPVSSVHRSKSIFRFAPKRQGTFANTHTVDEWLKFETHLEGCVFFHELMLFFSEVEGDDGF